MPRFIVHHMAQYLTTGEDAAAVRKYATEGGLDVRAVEEVNAGDEEGPRVFVS